MRNRFVVFLGLLAALAIFFALRRTATPPLPSLPPPPPLSTIPAPEAADRQAVKAMVAATKKAQAKPMPARIRGTVLEAGQPVSGAIARLGDDATEAHVTSDAEGHFEIVTESMGDKDVRVTSADGNKSATASVSLRAGEEYSLRLELQGGCSLWVEQVDERGDAVPEAMVWISRFASEAEMQVAESMRKKDGPEPLFELRTSMNQDQPRPPKARPLAHLTVGKEATEMRGLLPGFYELASVHRALGVTRVTFPLCPKDGRAARQRLVLKLGITLEGLVQDEEGRPVAAASLTMSGGERQGMFSIPNMASSGPNGWFRFANLKRGKYAITAQAAGSPQWTGEVEVPAEGVRGYRIVIPRGGTIEGRVLEADRSPTTDAWIVYAMIVEGYSRRVVTQADTAADGSFVLPALLSGTNYRIWAEQVSPEKEAGKRVNFRRFRRTQEISSVVGRPVELVAGPLARVHGQVRLPKDIKAETCTVRSSAGTVSCASGSYATKAETGYQALTASAEGCSDKVVSLKLSEGEDALIDIQLERALSMVVTVVDQHGKPIPGARVSAVPDFDPTKPMVGDFPGSMRSAASDEGGHAALPESDPSSRYMVSVTADGFTDGQGVIGGEAGASAVIQLHTAAMIDGELSAPAGIQLSQVMVGLRTETGEQLKGDGSGHVRLAVEEGQEDALVLLQADINEETTIRWVVPTKVPAGGAQGLRFEVPIGDGRARVQLSGGLHGAAPRLESPSIRYSRPSHATFRGDPTQWTPSHLVPGRYTLGGSTVEVKNGALLEASAQ
ncbi:MAG: carboxypeptidase-like regulatory domain-containing protein [Myxococcota bacterium]